jgi:hypothetical protein
MKVALYIYDDNISKRIELFDDEKISITSSIQNINDISKVFTDYSQSFTVPASDTNNRIFKHWYENAIDNAFDQRQRYKGYIEIDTQIFRTGQWQLESASIKNNRVEDYKITFYGVLKSLTDKFGEDKLKDLDTLNDYNVVYSGGLVANKIQTTDEAELDIAFPLISSNRVWQYGGGGTLDISQNSGAIGFSELFPAIRLPRVFEAIENKYGINFNGNFLTQSRFTDAYLWMKNKENFAPMGQEVLVNFTETLNELPANWAGLYLQTNQFYIKTDSFLTGVNQEGIYPTAFPGGTGDFSFAWGYKFDFSASVTWKVTILKEGAPFSVVTGTGTTTNNILLPTIQGTYQIYVSTTTSCTYTSSIRGDTISWVFVPSLGGYFPISKTVLGTSSGNATAFLNIPSYMPDMKISDFLSGILKMFNLTAFSFDEENYTLEQLENWYYLGTIYDFSEYCTTDFNYERIKPYKKVNFEYQKSESLLNRNYFNTNNQEYGDLGYTFSSDGSDYTIKLPFENIMFNKFTSTNLQVAYSINKDLQPYIPKPVILYKLKNQTGVNFKFNTGSSNITINAYNVFGQDVLYQTENHSLNWGFDLSSFYLQPINNGLFKDYYYDYLNNLYSLKSRLLKVTMRLPYSKLLSLRLNDRIVIRDKRYVINSFTTDLDTFESKFELIQDFRSINFNNSTSINTTETGKLLKFNTVSPTPLTWSIFSDPEDQIKSITNGADYVEVDIKPNDSAGQLIYAIQSNNNDIITIIQDA